MPGSPAGGQRAPGGSKTTCGLFIEKNTGGVAPYKPVVIFGKQGVPVVVAPVVKPVVGSFFAEGVQIVHSARGLYFVHFVFYRAVLQPHTQGGFVVVKPKHYKRYQNGLRLSQVYSRYSIFRWLVHAYTLSAAKI